eukprot:476805-Rhodomonas_salina.1
MRERGKENENERENQVREKQRETARKSKIERERGSTSDSLCFFVLSCLCSHLAAAYSMSGQDIAQRIWKTVNDMLRAGLALRGLFSPPPPPAVEKGSGCEKRVEEQWETEGEKSESN